ncbi:MAG TPA: ABC-F type ribosomal protection protein [Lachnospiraceae bacterium]|nr:ABC-F type ribosomal protection protein [Lachnospiraceae bacterium]HPF29508.1 ABC-F type ribosomal protection protein [Lachnospiraceae bacterium]
MLYQICNGKVAYADKVVLQNINFEIRNTEKIAVVGRNGCGKTTLLKLIMGELELDKRDSDEDVYITKAGAPVIGWLQQMTFDNDSVCLADEIRKVFAPILLMKARMEELLKAIEANATTELVDEYSSLEEQFTYLGGYRYEKDYEMVLSRFGFTRDDEERKLSEFSGGQRTKIAFIKLLLSKPDILLLDEPTNHLDISTIAWLEGYLKEYPRAVVIVSHDRMFLDRVADVVYEIEHQKMKRYPGNYSAFMVTKKAEHEKQEKDYFAQQKEIARLNQIVERFKNKPTKVAMTRSKLKQIEHMELIEKPENFDLKAFHTSMIPAKESGNDVLEVQNLSIGYKEVLAKVSFAMKKGQKIGIIGGNGLGKSTFLKTLTDIIPSKGGRFKLGYNVEIGYFDQQMAQYLSEKTVLDELWDEYPTLTQTEVRNILGGFLFTGEDVFKQVSMLSGGEKVRLALARIFQTKPNFLILDEPTNHMDIVGKEALEDMLKEYHGSVLFVSHDRYFIKQIADSLLIFENGQATFFPYGYEDYEEKFGSENRQATTDALRINTGKTENAPVAEKTIESKNYYNPGKEKAKRERRIARLEELLEENDTKIAGIKAELLAPEHASDYVKLNELQKEVDALEQQAEAYMEEWGQLQEEQ